MKKQENSHALYYVGLHETHTICRILKDKIEIPILYRIGLRETYWLRLIAAEPNVVWGSVCFRSFRRAIQEIYE